MWTYATYLHTFVNLYKYQRTIPTANDKKQLNASNATLVDYECYVPFVLQGLLSVTEWALHKKHHSGEMYY